MSDPSPSGGAWRFEASYELTVEDGMAMFDDIQNKHRPDKQLKTGRMILYALLVAVVVAAMWWFGPTEGPISFLLQLATFAMFLLLGIVAVLVYFTTNVRRHIDGQFRNDPGMKAMARQRLIADADGCVIRAGDHVETTYGWPAFIRITRRDGRTLLWLKNQEAVVVPDRGFASADDAEQFYHQADLWSSGASGEQRG